MANPFAQIGAVTGMNLRNIPQRWSSSLVAVLGVGALIKDYFPSFHIGAATVVMGLVLMFVFGLVTGAWPALTAMRLKIVDALRRI